MKVPLDSHYCFSCDSVEKLRGKCSNLEQEIVDPGRFKDFYQFTFNYAKNPGQKGLGKMEFVYVCLRGWVGEVYYFFILFKNIVKHM